jgi:hypothetical protein
VIVITSIVSHSIGTTNRDLVAGTKQFVPEERTDLDSILYGQELCDSGPSTHGFNSHNEQTSLNIERYFENQIVTL